MLRYNYYNGSGFPARQFGTNYGLSRYFYGRSDLHGYTVGEGFVDHKSGIPNGHQDPSSWILPMSTGGISSYRELNISFSAGLVRGTPGPMNANTSITFTTGATVSALGVMVGAVLPSVTLTPQNLAEAVWTANSVPYTAANTMGKQLNATKTNSDLIPATV